MEFSAELIDAASQLKGRAVAQLLGEAYPHVYRLATALAGRENVGRGIVRFVLARSMRVMHGWAEEIDARQWFLRYTIITSRRAARHRPDPQSDVLLGDAPEPEYLAAVAALRKLPHQQQEAFLLHHCEKAATRTAAVAMDCSILAFENHLAAANETLRLAAGARFDELVNRLKERYLALAPREELFLPRVQGIVRRYVWPRRIMRAIGWLLIFAIIAALAWAIPRLLRIVEI